MTKPAFAAALLASVSAPVQLQLAPAPKHVGVIKLDSRGRRIRTADTIKAEQARLQAERAARRAARAAKGLKEPGPQRGWKAAAPVAAPTPAPAPADPFGGFSAADWNESFRIAGLGDVFEAVTVLDLATRQTKLPL